MSIKNYTMRKLIALFMLFGILFAPMITKAQEETETESEADTTEEAAPVEAAPAPAPVMTDDDIVA